jgi:integrase/recombinase XerD
MGKATTAIVLFTKKIKQDGTYPVKLRVTYNRKQKYYGVEFSCTTDDFNKIMQKNPRGAFKDVRSKLNDKEKAARKIIENITDFSFTLFEKHYLSVKSDLNNVYSAFEAFISELSKEGRETTAITYRCALNSLKKYKSNLLFTDVTPEFLKGYDLWMRRNDNSKTTISIYLRCLRAMFNKAIDEKVVKESQYPFNRQGRSGKGYTIPQSANIKKALSLSDISLIFNYKVLAGTPEHKAHDLWIFSYLCNGMNLKDMALLKYSNIKNDMIIFERAKTATTNAKPVTIRIPLNDKIIEVIKMWGNKPALPDQYIFPILKNNLKAIDVVRRIRQAVKNINKYMKRIGKELNIESKITTYVARHSYATVLKRAGVSAEFISEALGHSNLKTTNNYLDSFEDGHAQKQNEHLTNFSSVELNLN